MLAKALIQAPADRPHGLVAPGRNRTRQFHQHTLTLPIMLTSVDAVNQQFERISVNFEIANCLPIGENGTDSRIIPVFRHTLPPGWDIYTLWMEPGRVEGYSLP